MKTLWRLAGFRAALVYTGLLVLAMGLVLGLLYARLAQDLRQSQDNLIWREAAVLSFTYQRDGVRGLAQALSVTENGQGRYFRLSNGLGTYIAGNLTKFPMPATTDNAGWLQFQHGAMAVRARLVRLDDDVLLLVGHDISAAENLLAGFRLSFALALAAMLLVGLGGGVFLARRGLQRVEAIGTELQPVMAGDLSARLAVSDSGAEWQTLQRQINVMLAQLEKLMQATRQVSDNLAHDLRAPLTRLRARLEGLLVDSKPGDELEAALDDVDGLLKSFNALLSLSRLDSGVAKLDAAPIDLSQLVTDMHELFAPVFEDRQMTLRLEGETPATAVQGVSLKGDVGLLGQAIVNGLENVLAHAAIPDSEVVLSVTADDRKLIIAIIDAGPGIAAEARDAAVQRFVQLDASRTQGGSGLGLSLMAAICSHHGGALHLADNQPGLRVEMHLPLSQGVAGR